MVALLQPPPVGELVGGLLAALGAQLAAIRTVAGPAQAGTRDPPVRRPWKRAGHRAPGYVLGSAGARLGLAGEVTAEQFERLFTGCDPESGELLGAGHRKDGRLGWDLVFRPVKSLSLLWGLGTPELSRIAREAHQAGVEAAIAKLETYAVVRRGRNGVEKLAAQGLLVVGFDHRESRPGDPLLHTHAAPRGALPYPPLSGEGLEVTSLGPMAHRTSKEEMGQ